MTQQDEETPGAIFDQIVADAEREAIIDRMAERTAHTPEPWFYSDILDNDGGGVLYGDNAIIVGASITRNPQRVANMRRIVACVNACAGINPEAVPDLLSALEKLKGNTSDG